MRIMGMVLPYHLSIPLQSTHHSTTQVVTEIHAVPSGPHAHSIDNSISNIDNSIIQTLQHRRESTTLNSSMCSHVMQLNSNELLTLINAQLMRLLHTPMSWLNRPLEGVYECSASNPVLLPPFTAEQNVNPVKLQNTSKWPEPTLV